MSERVFELIEAGDAEGLRDLLESDPRLAESRRPDGISAVLLARYQFELAALEVLLTARPRLDIFEAAAVGDVDLVRSELVRDPDLAVAHAADGFTALGLACFFGHRDTAQALLAAGARVNDHSRNPMRVAPLHSALAGRHAEVAELLLAAGADVNAVQADGYTPLHEAAQNGDLAMVQRLVAAGADPAARLDDGSLPADSARAAGHEDVAAWLTALQ